jgi:hypothetical protein
LATLLASNMGFHSCNWLNEIMPREQAKRVYGYYLRDDGELMIEVKPGEFVGETAARLGFVHPNLLADIERIKGRLGQPPRRRIKNPKPRQ